ncbi:peroxiredoxin family protein [Saltatorellus ferox]
MCRTLLLTALLLLTAHPLLAGGDEPPEVVFLEGPRMAAPLGKGPDRIDLPISLAPGADKGQAYFDQGLTQWYGGWPTEAARSFQTILIDDPDCAMAYWGLALANEDWPTRAAWFARAAWLKKGLAAPLERRLIDALAKFHGVDGPTEPEGLAEPWNPAPGEDRLTPLRLSEQPEPAAKAVHDLSGAFSRILEEHPSASEVRALRLALVASKVPEVRAHPEVVEEEFQSFFQAEPHHPIHARRMKFWLGTGQGKKAVSSAEVVGQSNPDVGKAWFLAAEVFLAAGRKEDALKCVQEGRFITFEHSRATWQQPSAWMDPRDLELLADEPGHVFWKPLQAPDWSLTDAYGKTHSLKDYRGKPLLVVDFLGFGCVHCLEQLRAIEPLADRFAEAGIAIVAIGLQSPKELRVSLGDDPAATGYSFPILCDPKLTQFRAYGAYDDFTETELHGTYLLDAEGGVRWVDISHLPYMEIEALLEDTGRLLGPAWKLR